MKFTHLHVHSHYSLLDGLAKIDELIDGARNLGMEAIALTDHGVLYGAIEFYKKAKKAGIKPIIGCEMYIAVDGMRNKRPGIDDKRFHLTVLAKNYEGYQNLIRLVTEAHLEGFYYKPRVDKEALRKYSDGLMALSGCLSGEISRAIQSKRMDDALRLANEYQDIFGKDNFYLELGAHPNIPEQKIVNSALVELSRKTAAKIVGTNDIHYLKADDAEAQDILVSVQTGARFEDENRLTMKADNFSMKSAAEMADFFRDIPEAVLNTQEITQNSSIDIPLGKFHLPYFSVPEGATPESFLRELCLQGVKKRYGLKLPPEAALPETKTIRERLEYELSVIKATGFTSYFLIVQDFVNWAKSHGIAVGPGRGSAAGSLVSYLLNITNVDPLKYNLLFERFLNPERIGMPDIDMDFADTGRDKVIEYVQQKYGRDRVAQIITFGTMAARAAIRDTGRALGMPYNLCDQIAKMIPFSPQSEKGGKESWLQKCLSEVAELKEIYAANPDAKRLIDSALKLEGVARHASTHAAGVVVAPDELTNYVPLQYATRAQESRVGDMEAKVLVTQYEMHAIEDLGLLKMDFLGLRNLTIIENAVKLIVENCNVALDLEKLPLDDKETFKLFQEGKTTGIFQFESSGMKRYLKELKPTELEDLTAMVALYRPGPMELIPSFVARKHGKEKITYLHPKLEPILKNTYGIGVYQEQMMQIARDLAGYTLPEADTLRKAIGKKDKALLDAQGAKLISGMAQNGIDYRTAQAVWELFPPFARYGFNRSHAASYALVAYQTAFLKSHWPAEFMAAVMTAEGFEIERVAVLVDECRAMSIKVLPPSIQKSNESFTVAGEHEIRFGLASVKNVGTNIVRAIIEARMQGGEFSSVTDFIERVRHKDLNKKSLESLIKCGALDGLGERNQLLENLDTILDYGHEHQREALKGQANLFSMSPQIIATAIKLKPAEPASKKEKLVWERELLGLYVSEHPLEEYRDKFQNKVTPLAELENKPRGMLVSIGGLIQGIKKIITKSGSPMLFVTLEDLTGKTEVLVFPRVLEKTATVWGQDKVVMIKGRISDSFRDDSLKILCEEAVDMT